MPPPHPAAAQSLSNAQLGAFMHRGAAANTQSGAWGRTDKSMFLSRGPFPPYTVLTGQQQHQSQNPSGSPLLFIHHTFSLFPPFPFPSGITLTGKSRISMPVPEFACRALRTPQQPSLCMGFLVICSQKRNSRRICDMDFFVRSLMVPVAPSG